MIFIAKILALGDVFNETNETKGNAKKTRIDANGRINLGKSLFTIILNPVAAKFMYNALKGKKLKGRKIGLILLE